MRRAACVIPAFEAAATIAAVVHGVRNAAPSVLIVVVDDGSTDATAAVARAAGADVILRHEQNHGKGRALRTGFSAILSMMEPIDAVVTIDADGQHDPAALPEFLRRLSTADLVIGARRRRGTSMPIHRRIANAVSTSAIAWCAGRAIRDSQCGFRGMRRALLERVPHVGDRYEAETAFVIRAARSGAILAEIEIPTLYGSASHFRTLRDAVRVIATIWSHRPSRQSACDSFAPTTTASSPMASTVWSGPLNRSGR